MEEKNYLVDVKTIKSVRVTCKNCSTALILPLSVLNIPPQCVNCCHELPYAAIKDLVRELKTFKNALLDDKITFHLHLEG